MHILSRLRGIGKKDLLMAGLVAVTAAGITWTGIVFKQSLFRIIPLYVSLIVGLLQSRANRWGYLLGGLNSILYAVVYFSFGLYASAASAMLTSFPFQIATFIRWSRHKYKHTTEFRRMKLWQWLLLIAVFALCFAGLWILLSATGSSYRLLDNSLTLVGLFTSVLTLFAFKEYTFFMLGSGTVNILLNASMMAEYPAQITYLIYSVYSMFCIVRQFFFVNRLFREQKMLAAKKGE